MNQSERNNYIANLMNKRRQVVHRIKYFADGNFDCPDSLFDILSIDESKLNQDGRELLEFLEQDKTGLESGLTFENFKWKLTVFVSIQDIFDIKFYNDYKLEHSLQLRYFFYESKYILTEAILSGLNGLYVANKQLIRTFIEFNLMQNYFVREIERTSSFKSLSTYFTKPFNPSFSTLVNKAIPNDTFSKPIKKRIQVELNSVSSKFNHAHDPSMSPKLMGVFSPENTLETAYFWIHWSFVLDMVLWMYYVNYPMLFVPVNIVRKFGFNPPQGLFVDSYVGGIIEKSITPSDYKEFVTYAKSQQVVADLLDFYSSYPDLTDEEIWKTWDGERTAGDTIEGNFLKLLIKMRTLQEISCVNHEYYNKDLQNFDEKSIIERISTFSSWKNKYKDI